MTLADGITYVLASAVACASWRCPTALVLTIWYAVGLALWGVFGSVNQLAGLAIDICAVLGVFILARHWRDYAAAGLLSINTIAGFAMEPGPYWTVSWLLGNIAFILVAIGAIPPTDEVVEKRVKQRTSVFDDVFRRFWGWC
jgi:hypothetical protein